jgi:hypothetical protein
MKRFLFFFIVFFSVEVHGQIATATFDPTVMNFNPAIAGSRFFGGYYTSLNYRKIKASGTETGDIPDQNLTNLNADWDVEDEIKSFNFLYSNIKNNHNLFPEVFVTRQNLTSSFTRTDNKGVDPVSGLEEESDITTAHLNLAYDVIPNLSVGAHLAYSKIDQYVDADLRIEGGPVSEIRDTEIDMTGYGIGLKYKLPYNLYVGAFYAYYGLDQTGTQTANYGSGDQTQSEARELEFKSHGYALAYQVGTSEDKALKVEISESRNTNEVSALNKGIRRRLGVEAMNKKFYGGFSINQLKGNFINFQSIVDSLLSERVNSDKTTMNYGIAAGFRTTSGHSFGGSASYSKETIDSAISFINRNKFASEVENLTVSLSYAYIVF